MLPSLVTQFIILVKDTSLASIIGYMDLTKAAQTVNHREIRPFELYLFIAVVYWVLCYGMSLGSRALERRRRPARACRGGDHRGGPRHRRRPRPRSGETRGRVLGPAWWSVAGALAPSARTWSDRTPPWPSSEGSMGSVRISVGSRSDVAGVRAAIESDSEARRPPAGAEEARARQDQETMASHLSTTERRVEELADSIAGLEVAVATLAEQFARLEAGSSSVAASLRRAAPGPARGTLHLGRGALRPRDGKLPRRRARTGSPGLRGVRGQAPGAPARGQRPLLDRGSLLPEPGLRAGCQQVPEGDRPRSDRGANPRRPAPPRARAPLAPREDRAREVWARLVRDFPDSEAALRVRAVLRQPSRAVRPAEPR